MEFVLTIIMILLLWYIEKKNINLFVVIFGLIYIALIILMCFISVFSFILMIKMSFSIIEILFIVLILIVLFILVLFLSKSSILMTFNIISYYFSRRKVIENGVIITGKIIDIKVMGIRKGLEVYYLIVDLNGKKIKSFCFLNNKYSIGKNIQVLVYKNYNYVIL